MAFKILTDGGYDIVFEPDVAREYVHAYKQTGIFRGMLFLPFFNGTSHIHETY